GFSYGDRGPDRASRVVVVRTPRARQTVDDLEAQAARQAGVRAISGRIKPSAAITDLDANLPLPAHDDELDGLLGPGMTHRVCDELRDDECDAVEVGGGEREPP